MRVTVKFFAQLREMLGVTEESVDVPEAVASVSALRAWLAARDEHWGQALAPGRNIRAAMNQAMVVGDAPLVAGAEVAFFPPVTGG